MLLIFDWDGTLSDSTEKIIACMQNAARSSDFPVCSKASIKNIIGLGLPEAIRALYPALLDSDRDKIKTAYVEHFLSEDKIPSPFFEGVVEGLTRLRDNHFSLCVATGKSRRGLNRVLTQLNLIHFFHGTRCADETASKPDPLMLTELLHEFHVNSDQAVMVGDTEYDMSMAKKIDMPRVAVSYGAHHLERLKPYEPVLCVDDFSDFVLWAMNQ